MLTGKGTVDLWPEDRAMPHTALKGRIGAATALYGMLTDRIDADLLDAAPHLAVVSQMAVGVDNVDVAACTERGIPVGHTPDVLTETVADTAFGLLIAAARRFGEGVDYVRAGRWVRWEPDLLLGSDVHGSVLGIVGLGRIGAAVARRARGFGMTIVYTGRAPRPEAAELGARFLPLDELLPAADHVVVTAMLTAETRHLIDADAFAAMKPTATLVNVSRGGLVDTDALVAALRSGDIEAAALDVTDPEPLPADHELVGLGNCIVLPHLGSSSAQTRTAMAELAAENLIAGLRGARLPACANPEVYDR
ncbi:MAG: 2-hydroxyacid dehydrogenase [Acidimicrobiia bacterium]